MSPMQIAKFGYTFQHYIWFNFDFPVLDGSCFELALEGERLCKAGDCIRGIEYLEAAAHVGTDDFKTLSAIYGQLGTAYFCLQNYEKSLEYHTHDLCLARQIGDRVSEAKASGNLGNTFKVVGQYEEAFACCQRHLDIAREFNNKAGEAKALYNLGNVFHAKGKQLGRVSRNDPGEYPPESRESLETAIRYYEANLTLVREINDKAALGRTCGNLGNTHYLLGNFIQAIRYHEERLAIAKEFGDKSAERRACSNLGNAHMFLGEFQIATELYNKTLQIAIQLGDRALEAQACYSLGNTYTLLRDYEQAIKFHIRHLRIAQELKDRIGEGRACWSLGNAYTALNKPEKAVIYASQHLEISKEVGDANGLALAQVNLADLQNMLCAGDEANVKRVNSCREKADGKDEDTISINSRSRRHSMENLELVKLTPDKLNQQESCLTGNMSRTKQICRTQKTLMLTSDANDAKKKKSDSKKMPSVDIDDDNFFDLLSKFQSRRIDDQRCCSSVLSNHNRVTGSRQSVNSECEDDKENEGIKANSPLEDDFLDMIAGIQGSRMNDQRADGFPGQNGGRIIDQFVQRNGRSREESTPDDQFFEMLMRCQGARIDGQRSELPPVPTGPTVPDEDFISLIQRFQCNRLEEQRTMLPVPNQASANRLSLRQKRDK